ncbi:hypothetical protein, partial [Klebsiella pneumoniae]
GLSFIICTFIAGYQQFRHSVTVIDQQDDEQKIYDEMSCRLRGLLYRSFDFKPNTRNAAG